VGKLGILVNSDRHGRQVQGLARATRLLGHTISIFVMDSGTRLLRDAAFVELSGIEGVNLSFCQHSADNHKVETAGLPPAITRGTQLNNVKMQHAADRVIVL